MASVKEKIAYALGDAAAGGIVWKVMSIAFPLFFTNVFGLSFADAAVLMLVARMFDVVTDPLPTEHSHDGAPIALGSSSELFRSDWCSPCCSLHLISEIWVSASMLIPSIC